MLNRPNALFVAVGILAALSSCNVFSPIDQPSGDAQILSAARACFDKGDIQCALDQYSKLPGNDYALSERAITTLDQNGIDIALFAQALTTTGGAGTIINTFVNALSATAGTSKRAALLTAYTPLDNIQNQTVRGFTRFLVGLALSTEILAEINTVQASRVLHKTDIVTTPGTCATSADITLACTVGNAPCAIPGASNLIQGANNAANGSGFATASSFTLTGTPSLWMFYNSIKAMNQGLNEMHVSAGSSFSLVNSLLNTTPTPDPSLNGGQCTNATLVNVLGAGI